MKFRTLIASIAVATAGLAGPALVAAPAHASSIDGARHACTHTSSGKCIKGGQFCPKAKKGKSGWSATGKRYVCRGGSHPHWRLP